mgnify:CR=1 FL=1
MLQRTPPCSARKADGVEAGVEGGDNKGIFKGRAQFLLRHVM